MLKVEKSQGQINDEAILAALGYKQELRRGWGLMRNFGISFSIISVTSGITTLFAYGLATGGPAVMSWGWICVAIFTMFVALSMAEIVSACPTSGGPYHWAAILAPPKYSAQAAWFTGYFNLLGQIAVTTAISYGCAGLIATTASLYDFVPTPANTLGIFAGLLFLQGFVNSFGVKIMGWLNYSSVLFQSFGIGSVLIALLIKAPTHRTFSEVFLFFNDSTGVTVDDLGNSAVGWSIRASPAYVAACGIILSSYTLTGFDASAHMSEETRDASRAAPWGVIISVGSSAVFGFFLLLSYLFCIQDFDNTIGSATGSPVLQIFLDCFGETGATAAMGLVIICVMHCGIFSTTANSRMMFAFSRDRALPHFLNRIDHRFGSPVRTVWASVFLAFLLAIPSLFSSVAFAACTTISTIGLYNSYMFPILIMVVRGKGFKKGPFDLGKWSRPIGIVSCLWITFTTIAFCLPTQNEVTSQTVNYTPAAVGIVTLYCVLSWYLWAKNWFVGPRKEALDIMSAGSRDSFNEDKKDAEGEVYVQPA